jgi:nitronate monooxygenase
MRALRPVEETIAPYPIQNALTAYLRAAAIKANSVDVMSLWAGQSVKLARPGKAGDITKELWRQAQAVMRARTTRFGGVPGSKPNQRRGSLVHMRAPRTFQDFPDDQE